MFLVLLKCQVIQAVIRNLTIRQVIPSKHPKTHKILHHTINPAQTLRRLISRPQKVCQENLNQENLNQDIQTRTLLPGNKTTQTITYGHVRHLSG